MKQIIFVTATNTNVGKTYASKLLLKSFAKKSYKVAYFKPIETGVDLLPKDISKCVKLAKKLNPLLNQLHSKSFYSYLFALPASPFVANSALKSPKKIKPKKIIKKALALFEFCDVLIIEGSGGLFVPIKQDYFIIDLIKDFQKVKTYSVNTNKYKIKTKTILISPSQLGNINTTFLSFRALKSYKIKFKWYINLHKHKKSFKKISLPFYKSYINEQRLEIRYLHKL